MSDIRIRKLNDEGIRRFAEFLDSQTGPSPQLYGEAAGWLTSKETSEGISGMAEANSRHVFPRRFDLAAYLYERVPRLNLDDPTRDAGLWTWFALLWFEQLCPAQKGGVRKPGRQYRYIPELDNYQTYYRHRVLGPYLILAAHADSPERALCMLCQPPSVHPDTAEQLASRSDLIQSPALVAAATRMYYNPQTRDIRTGSTSYKGSVAKPGTLRRLVDVCWQFDRTYDHLACDATALIKLLPSEFDRFRKQAPTGTE